MEIMEAKEIVETPQVDESWKVKSLLIGGALGALAGLAAAFLLTRKAEQKGQPLAITPAKGMRLGVIVAGLLRSILSLGED
jgi:hypothetical protein